MANYNFYASRISDIANARELLSGERQVQDAMRFRFGEDFAGREYWMVLISELFDNNSPEEVLARFQSGIRQERGRLAALKCPRVFISHRQSDKAPALRVAYLANNNGFDHWLDVEDPFLKIAQALAGILTDEQQKILVAAIIEIALLNCTHVLAVITKNSPGSLWIPYEYGRVKEKELVSIRAACWLAPEFKGVPVAEYLYLGEIWQNEGQIGKWFVAERTLFPECSGQDPWSGAEPDKLPGS